MTTDNQRRPLSPRQSVVLRALVLWTHRHKCQPSIRELATACGVSSVQKQLVELEVKGWIKGSGHARSIEIPGDVYEEIVNHGEVAP